MEETLGVLNVLCVCGEVFSLEPQGNDFTSSGQLGFLLIQTMSGCGALNRERRADERERKKERKKRMRRRREKERDKVRQAKRGGWIRARTGNSGSDQKLTTEQNSTSDHTPQWLVNETYMTQNTAGRVSHQSQNRTCSSGIHSHLHSLHTKHFRFFFTVLHVCIHFTLETSYSSLKAPKHKSIKFKYAKSTECLRHKVAARLFKRMLYLRTDLVLYFNLGEIILAG